MSDVKIVPVIRGLYQGNVSWGDQLRGLGEEFFAESKLPGTLDWDYFHNTWDNIIQGGYGFMYVAQCSGELHGVIAGLISQDMFTGALLVMENFWYVARAHRSAKTGILLHRTFEDHAKRVGADRIIMVGLDTVDSNPHNYYIGCGYVPMERNYLKVL